MKGHIKEYIDFDMLSFEVICDKIRKGEHFSFARYGDGEFAAIMGTEGANCDGHPYYPQMGKELWKAFQNAPYYLAVHQGRMNWRETYAWLKEHGETRKFASNAVFHIPTRDGTFQPFWNALEGKKVCIVSPKYVRKQNVIPSFSHIPVSEKNTYMELHWIKDRLRTFTENRDISGYVFLICASMTAPLIVDHLYKQYGDTATFIDFGSSFDPVVGRKSRSYHKVIQQ